MPPFGADEHPCTTYFDVHQGYRVFDPQPSFRVSHGASVNCWCLVHSLGFERPSSPEVRALAAAKDRVADEGPEAFEAFRKAVTQAESETQTARGNVLRCFSSFGISIASWTSHS